MLYVLNYKHLRVRKQTVGVKNSALFPSIIYLLVLIPPFRVYFYVVKFSSVTNTSVAD